jgi:hypothetical protein
VFVNDRIVPSTGLVDWSLTKVVPVGVASDGLLAVRGILSSLLRSSFFSYEAKAGSPSTPLAPLIMGTVGCIVLGTPTAADCWAWRL